MSRTETARLERCINMIDVLLKEARSSSPNKENIINTATELRDNLRILNDPNLANMERMLTGIIEADGGK